MGFTRKSGNPNAIKSSNILNGDSKGSLSQQYGGVHSARWVDYLPARCIPYIQLCRLSPPTAFFLIFFPHFFGVLHAASVHTYPISKVTRTSLLLLGGSFFFSNASHAWNDLIDAPIDKMIARTRTRPIPRGDITPLAAAIFTIIQALAAASFLFFLPRETTIIVVPTIIGTTYYPFAKRHTHFPQLVLGFCLTWGIMVGSSAMGVSKPWTDTSTIYLLLASILWVIIFDTIYAYQDLADDIKIGVKSTAVLFRNYAKLFLWVLYLGMVASVFASGYFGGMGILYYTLAVGGCAVSVGGMVIFVDLNDSESCWIWFSQGFWLTGATIACGLMTEYILHSGQISGLNILSYFTLY